MKPLSNKTASRPGSGTDASERYVRYARAAILWERAWRASWPATGLLGLFIAAALFGLIEPLPQSAHLSLLFFVVFAAGVFLHQNLMGFKIPRWEDGARRVEQDSTLAHRPITEGNDRLAAGEGDPWAEELWRAHLRQMLARIVDLKVRWPKPGLQTRDRYALRFVTLVLVLGGFVWAGSDAGKRLALAFTPESGAGGSVASLDAWINPPAYTGQAPIYLQHPAEGESVAVPTGSELVLRVHSSHGMPHLALQPEPDDRIGKFTGTAGEYGANVILTRNRAVRVMADGKLLAHFFVTAVPDDPPHIAFAKPPAKTAHDALEIAFTAGDDYGVVSARAIIRPVAKNARAILSVDLPLTQSSAKTLSQTVYRDLTGEPLAGAMVSIVLEAKDGAGQTGTSKPAVMRLPARVFTNPLARALVEQRQNLAINAPQARENVAFALDALSIAPEKFYAQDARTYLAIRTAYWSLRNLESEERAAQARHRRYTSSEAETFGVEKLLWDTAVSLEQGGLLTAANELRQLQQLLSEALQQGAPQEVIEALLDRYKQALQRYLQSLAQNGQQQNNQMSSNSKTITPADLDQLLKAIEQMSQTGSRDAAAKALAMLQQLLENLHAGSGAGGAPTDKALSDAIQGLGDIIGRQRQLLDKTYRQQQGAGDPKDGGGKGLGNEQGKLRDDLGKLEKGLGPQKAPKNLGDAGKQMGDAQGHLGSNDFDNAEAAEKNALQAMQDTADQLAKKMMDEAGQNGQPGQGQDTDPLGRAQGTNGPATGSGVKIPDRDELARARSILEELRRRAAQRGRPKEELDYYDRLLKEF